MKEARKRHWVLVLVAAIFTAGAVTAQIAFPNATSATLTYHIDASDMNNDGGVALPVDGTNITSWKELTTGAGLNIQATPSWHASGLNGRPAVRFFSAVAFDDLVFSNDPLISSVSAQTIVAVATMTNDAYVLSDLVSSSSGSPSIRQTTQETANYFAGNGGDFHWGGTFHINGNQQFAIPGGFGAAHVIKSMSPSVKTINSLRVGDNTNDRRWSGDVAELMVYNARLGGDDTLALQEYLTDKYGIALKTAFDERLSEAKQIAINPFVNNNGRYIGVNFHYGGPTVDTLFEGIGFDNIDLAGGSPPTGPFALSANASTAGTTLALNLPFAVDNAPRSQNANITGTDAATLNAIANEFFYLGTNEHSLARITFGGLLHSVYVFVQVIGGDTNWNGDIQVQVNGGKTFEWLGVSDGGAAGTASLFGFFATTDGAGQLQLDFTVSAGNWGGIGGIILTDNAPTGAVLVVR